MLYYLNGLDSTIRQVFPSLPTLGRLGLGTKGLPGIGVGLLMIVDITMFGNYHLLATR